ncbi:Next to BRCA1 protein1 protein [Holothuria leucospilota]|uniref:Next to BRCA1 protein1 protein n=1 Tax=Holothuria leucospilota TaxID=206669 RepID=A0A9Q0YC98_HOLLE|nr:Next to BRCA1 protein1 protein [Holothuria leucospilota]
MASSLALEFEFNKKSQICVVGYDTAWIDVYAMIKCSLDLDDIEIKYLDDENDEVNLSSEEEYVQAREVARKSGDVLKFTVYDPKSGIQKEPVTQTRAVSKPTPNSRYDPVTGCALSGAKMSGKNEVKPLASISISQDTLGETKRPPDKFVNNIVQDILQGLDGSIEIDEETEEMKATQKKIRQGIKQKVQSTNIEWSPSCKRIPKKIAQPNEEFVNKVVQGVLSGLNGSEIRSAREAAQVDYGMNFHIHEGVTCDACKKAIVGIRYKCGHCPDFDLCEKCEASGTKHDENHVFLKIRKPAILGLGQRFDGQCIPLLEVPVYPTDENLTRWEQKKLKYVQKIARKIAKVEMKHKCKEEKRKRKEMGAIQVSPTKRERLEKKSEKQQTLSSQSRSPKDWTKVHEALLVSHTNFPPGTHLQPKTKFTKSWQVLNGGDISFDDKTKLKFLWGNIPNISEDPTPVCHLLPGQEGTVSVECEAPGYPGTYQSVWRLVQDGEQFGQRISCNIVVDEAEILEPKEDKSASIQDEMLITKTENTMEACDAVANLQPDQSDGSSPNKVISNNTEVLTAQDILSFEMLKISKKDISGEEDNEMENEVQAVATPNNTPSGMTPCMSPVPQLDAESLNTKMEERRIEETEEQLPLKSDSSSNVDGDMVIVDHVSEDNTSIDSSDEDLIGDFYVVPLPDCFDLNKPLEECVLSTSTLIATEEEEATSEYELHVTPQETPEEPIPSPQEMPMEAIPIPDIDALLATSHTLIQTPLVPLVAATPVQPQTEIVPHTIVAGGCSFAAPEIVLDISSVSDDSSGECGFVISPEHEVAEEVAREDPVPVEEQEEGNVEEKASQVKVEEEENQNEVEIPVPDDGAMTPDHQEPDVESGEVFHDAEDHSREDAETDANAPQEDGDEIPREGESEEEANTSQTEYGTFGSYQLPNSQDQAREILGYTAARAAAVASSVMKQAYDAANTAVTALLTPPPPTPSPANSETPPRSPMDTLIEMGFANRDKNRQLLYKYNNDVNQCVQDLLSEDIENWHLTRH